VLHLTTARCERDRQVGRWPCAAKSSCPVSKCAFDQTLISTRSASAHLAGIEAIDGELMREDAPKRRVPHLELPGARIGRKLIDRKEGRALPSRYMAGRGRWSAVGGCLALVVVLLGACGSSTSSDASTRSVDAAVIAGWKAALKAFDAAERTANWKSSALNAAYVEPQLGIVRANLLAEGVSHEVARGQDRVVNVKVVVVTNRRASLVSCVYGNEIITDSSTGRPVSGILGQGGPEEFRSTMVLAGSVWKLEAQTVTEGACASV
jgi:hypothetical protein